MLNNTTNNNLNLNNPATGIIQKSHEKSFFKYMAKGSSYCSDVFGEQKFKGVEIDVLQVMLMSDGFMMIELIHKSDFTTLKSQPHE